MKRNYRLKEVVDCVLKRLKEKTFLHDSLALPGEEFVFGDVTTVSSYVYSYLSLFSIEYKDVELLEDNKWIPEVTKDMADMIVDYIVTYKYKDEQKRKFELTVTDLVKEIEGIKNELSEKLIQGNSISPIYRIGEINKVAMSYKGNFQIGDIKFDMAKGQIEHTNGFSIMSKFNWSPNVSESQADIIIEKLKSHHEKIMNARKQDMEKAIKHIEEELRYA